MKQQHSFAISSIIRQNRSSKDGLAPVYLRITCDSKRSEIFVHIFVDPNKWNSAKGRVQGTSEDVRRLNQGKKRSSIAPAKSITSTFWLEST